MELHQKGLGANRIAAQLSNSHSLSVAPGTISHWIAGNRRPRLRNIFEAKPSKALGYIIGANLGDGCKLVKSGCVKLEVTDLEFAQTFNSEMAKLFSRDSPNKILIRRFETGRLPLYIVKYNSRQLTDLLTLPLKRLLRIAFAYPREFLRGFFDAEGHVDVLATTRFHVSAGIENSNRRLLFRIKQILMTVFHISSSIYKKRESGSMKVIRGKTFRMRKPSFTLLIMGLRHLQKFRKLIGFSIPRKNQMLTDALFISINGRPKERVARWNQEYFKLNGEWVKRQTLGSS
jgi:DNA endonuclease